MAGGMWYAPPVTSVGSKHESVFPASSDSSTTSDSPDASALHNRSSGGGQRFVWPPARGQDSAGPDNRESGGGSLPDDAREPAGNAGLDQTAPIQTGAGLLPRDWPWWRRAEQALLDVQTPPLTERLAIDGWQPDPVRSFCWRCGENAGPYSVDDRGCAACRDGRVAWDRFVRLGVYQRPLRPIIHDVKFTAWRRLGMDIGKMLGEQIARAIEADLQSGAISRAECQRVTVVPVPSAWWHRMRRGIDHTAVLARGVVKGLAAAHETTLAPVLQRELRPSQTEVRASERTRNVAGSMHMRGSGWENPLRNSIKSLYGRESPSIEGTLWVIVDDVKTTGATMGVACDALRRGLLERETVPAGKSPTLSRRANVWAAAIAVAGDGSSQAPSDG